MKLWQICDFVRGWPPPCHPVLGKLGNRWCTRWASQHCGVVGDGWHIVHRFLRSQDILREASALGRCITVKAAYLNQKGFCLLCSAISAFTFQWGGGGQMHGSQGSFQIICAWVLIGGDVFVTAVQPVPSTPIPMAEGNAAPETRDTSIETPS